VCTLLRAHASQTSTKRAGDSAQAQRKGAQRPACVHLCARGGVLKPQTIFGPQLFKAVNKVFKSTSWSLGTNRQFERKFQPFHPNFYLKRHLGYFYNRHGPGLNFGGGCSRVGGARVGARSNVADEDGGGIAGPCRRQTFPPRSRQDILEAVGTRRCRT
jgi:hypothetical protein